MNQISQWSFQHPILAALIACLVLFVIYDFGYFIFQIIANVLMRFQWWMIAGRLRDKDGHITRDNIESFGKLVGKIKGNDKHKKDKEGNS